jgi:hypothetical protein
MKIEKGIPKILKMPFILAHLRYYHSLWCNWLVLGAPVDSAGLTDFTHFSKYYEN